MQLADYATRFETLKLERNDGVLEMTMHTRGGEVQWNVSPAGHHAELGQAFAAIAADKENKVVILTGTGSTFVAARDAQEVVPEANLHDMWDRMMEESVAMIEGLLSIPVPVICAVNGPAMIHSEIPVMCDVVLAAEHAVFADTTHMPYGMPPGDGTMIWQILLGPNRGRYFLLSGEHLGAVEAQRLGVVGEVLPANSLMPRAREFAARLAGFQTRSLRHAKTLMIRHLRQRIRDEMELGLFAQGMAII
jgi:enoyl-CoA hydratase/carnithine racemase